MTTLVSSHANYQVRISQRNRPCTTAINGGDTRMCDLVITKGDEYVAQVILDQRGNWLSDTRKYCRTCACTKIKCITLTHVKTEAA